MKNYVLNYYPDFKCVASECKHTCCAGWEMNIDEQTLLNYQSDNSPFNSTLKKGINFKKACFKLDKDGRCAFLNKEGLCEIIINLGQQSLCQVCLDHPRFRSFFDDRIETGLGFCCEEATKIILSYKDKIKPLLISDDGEQNELDFNQKNILEFREKALSTVQDRSQDINQRINSLLVLCNAKIDIKYFSKVLKTYLSFECLDKTWKKRLKSIKNCLFANEVALNLTNYAEQFLVNSLYRHLYDAEDIYEVRARTIACVFGWWTINSVFNNEKDKGIQEFDLVADVVRAYSTEVEYSQKNLGKLFSLAYKFVKI